MSGPDRPSLDRRLAAEAVGSAFLLAAVVGSGIMGERLAGGNVAVALLANTLATGAALVALILTFGPISGAHLNPAVTLAAAAEGGLPWREAPLYISAQIIGAFGGVAAAHTMFEAPLFSASQHARSGPAQVFSEFVATFGLLAVIWGCARLRSSVVPFAVAAYITAAYWFTASTSFANPAVTLARSATDTFAGIRPADAPAFIAAQLLGAATATGLFRWLAPAMPKSAPEVVVRSIGMDRHKEAEVTKKRVLFLCTHNSARSQMAEGFLRARGGDRFEVQSAGTEKTSVHPLAIRAMAECGIDISGHTSKVFVGLMRDPWDYLITVCDDANERCPLVPGVAKRLHWPLEDPSRAAGTEEERLAAFRRVRDQIEARLAEWLGTQESQDRRGAR